MSSTLLFWMATTVSSWLNTCVLRKCSPSAKVITLAAIRGSSAMSRNEISSLSLIFIVKPEYDTLGSLAMTKHKTSPGDLDAGSRLAGHYPLEGAVSYTHLTLPTNREV